MPSSTVRRPRNGISQKTALRRFARAALPFTISWPTTITGIWAWECSSIPETRRTLTTTDFLEHIGPDPDVKAVIMYIEALKEGSRFAAAAREISKSKPVIVYKAGKTPDAARAAHSHTGSLAGSYDIYEGALDQSNVVTSPTMELLLPLGDAMVERPPMRGNRVVILTMGGSWGVALTDALEAEGLRVPELSAGLQSRMRELGMPIRASVKNPVDIGASGLFFDKRLLIGLGREILTRARRTPLFCTAWAGRACWMKTPRNGSGSFWTSTRRSCADTSNWKRTSASRC